MGVHDLASYVKYHQQKLREQQTQTNAASPQAETRPKKRGVDTLNSRDEYRKALEQEVNPLGEAHKGQVVFLDAFATWCGPCKMIAPTISQWSEGPKYSGKVAFYKFDVDQVTDLAQELGVRAMPTFFIFKNGELVETVVGADPKNMESKLDAVLALGES